MLQLIGTILREEQGQDMIEYTLLIAFLALATASFFGMGNSSIRGIVSTSTSQIKYGNDYANGH